MKMLVVIPHCTVKVACVDKYGIKLNQELRLFVFLVLSDL